MLELNDTCQCYEHMLARAAETQGIMIGLHYARTMMQSGNESLELTDEVIAKIRKELLVEHRVEHKHELKLVDTDKGKGETKAP
jgi:hypothetical protein